LCHRSRGLAPFNVAIVSERATQTFSAPTRTNRGHRPNAPFPSKAKRNRAAMQPRGPRVRTISVMHTMHLWELHYV